MKIVYPTAYGISVIHRVDESISFEVLANKAVPEGLPYLIVEDSDIPSSRELRLAWTADFSNPTGYSTGGIL